MPRCPDGARDLLPAVACGPGLFLLGQRSQVKVRVLAEPAKDIAAVCNHKISLHLGGWDFALGKELSRAAIVLPPSPSAPEQCCVMEMKSRAVLTSGLVRRTCGYQTGGLEMPESCWLFPKPGAAVQAPALLTLLPVAVSTPEATRPGAASHRAVPSLP